jgi:hypothetical protein
MNVSRLLSRRLAKAAQNANEGASPRASLRPELTILVQSSRVPTRIAYVTVFLALCMIFVPTAQLSWRWKFAFAALAALSWREAHAFAKTAPQAIRITPDDQIELRRRYDKGEFSEFEPITPRAPLFVSPLIVSFSTVQHGRFVLFSDQVIEHEWRALRVRLTHLRTLQ